MSEQATAITAGNRDVMIDNIDNALARASEFTLPTPDETQHKLAAIRAFQVAARQHLIQGSDYGAVPGTNRPTLLKPGAEKLVRLLGLTEEYTVETLEDWDKPFFAYRILCALRFLGTGQIVTRGLGECNSLESRYRWRWVFRSELDNVGASPDGLRTRMINTKNGRATQYRIDNEDIYSQVNTILKMAKKRALVDAALSAGRLSDIFTQDMEDLPDPERTPSKKPNKAPAGKTNGQATAGGQTTTESEGLPKCGECGTTIAGVKLKDGTNLPSQDIVRRSTEKFGRPLCVPCAQAAG